MITLLLSILTLLHFQDFDMMRANMVSEQLLARGISDTQVIDAMLKVPRQVFVPGELQNRAYQDCPLPIGYQQTISQPYIVAYMSEQLHLSTNDRVLEIGTGSGYQTAVLAEITKEVYTIEIIKALGLQAQSTLQNEGYDNITYKIGDGYHGWSEYAPFDAIIVTASPNNVPKDLLNQLSDGGKLIIPVEEHGQQYLMLYTKTNQKIKKKRLIPVRFVPFLRQTP